MRTTSILLFALAGLLAAAPATAQLSLAVTAQGQVDGVTIDSAECGRAFVTGVTVSCVRNGAADAEFFAAARANPRGDLLGAAYARHDGAATFTAGIASASWTERVFYTPLDEPTLARVSIRLTGTQVASSSSDGTSIGALATTFMRLGLRRDGDPALEAFDEVVLRRQLADYGAIDHHTLGIGTVERGVSSVFSEAPVDPRLLAFDLALASWLDPGSSFFDWNWQFATNAFAYPGWNADVATFYFGTARIVDIRFLNESGIDVTDLLDVRFASGADYRVAVPEPAPGALLLTGLGLLGLTIARRRKIRPVEPA